MVALGFPTLSAHGHFGVPPSLPAPSQASPALPCPHGQMGGSPSPASPMHASGSPTLPLVPLHPGLTPVLRGPEDAVRQDDGRLQVREFLPLQCLIPWQAGTRKAALVQPHHRHHCGTMSPTACHGIAPTNPEAHRLQHIPTPGHTDPSIH